MTVSRRRFAQLLAISLAAPLPAFAQASSAKSLMLGAMSGDPRFFFPALDEIKERGSPDMAAPLIQALRFSRGQHGYILEVLRHITGEKNKNDWFDWMLWQEANPQIKPHPDFTDFKRDVMLQIDPNFDDFLKTEYIQPDKMEIRLEEITWGGVRKDGIPSLDNPTMINASAATYMRGDDLVFGVEINGDTRAYPLRIMGWHEMFNDRIGGVEVALAYCTLCGSGILFETKVKGRSKPLIFGSSGFLYRSNKLMFDRATNSLWNQFTGKPVVGKLVGTGIELEQRPVVITTWDNWRNANPSTKILSLDTGHRRDYGSGVVYNDYFSSNDLMFPTQVDQRRHRQKDYVFGIREFGANKAWPLKAFKRKKVINDAIGQTPLVLIGDAKTRSVRAYERGPHSFKTKDGKLQSQDGRLWTASEDALTSGQDRLPRVAGHIAYWFAWNGYIGAKSEVYKG